MNEAQFNAALAQAGVRPPSIEHGDGFFVSSLALRKLADLWFAAGRADALRDAVAEWEKPWGMSDGRQFIDRLRAMS